tara:strand:- start:1481 stop:1687 length:207 start_codon:yes stop_codon:yes gene_type:complete
MIMSVSTLTIGSGAATPLCLENFFIAKTSCSCAGYGLSVFRRQTNQWLRHALTKGHAEKEEPCDDYRS